VPQLIMPMSHDQPNNAHWVKKLGAGDRLLPGKFTGPRVAAALAQLLGSAEVKARCTELATRCAAQDAIGETANLIEAAVAVREGEAPSEPLHGSLRDPGSHGGSPSHERCG
jgi:UDP:flavonoid glycosyltransferase YjiC (YdhE family)